MKKTLPLKWLVLAITLFLTTCLIIGFIFLSGRYFLLGMDNVIAGHMEHSIHEFHRVTPVENRQMPSRYDGFLISSEWQQQPASFQRVFEQAPNQTAHLFKVENIRYAKQDKGVFFAMYWQIEGQNYFISHHLTRGTLSSMVHNNIKRSRDNLKLIGLGSIVLFSLIFWLVMRRVSQPIAALNQWTRDLSPETLNQPVPSFAYTELNEQAELIRSSLSSVQDSLEREQKFLRHASHELRTPISVIRSNMDLLKKLNESSPVANDQRQLEVYQRIDRASLTMKNLTETLLWLSRDEQEVLPTKPVQLDQLLRLIIEENRYLIDGKPVTLEVKTQDCTLQLSAVAVRIVLSNLIRNAFQHTCEGEVLISQSADRVQIENKNSAKPDNSKVDSDLGFGLGLQLTSQLTQRLNWEYENRVEAAGHHATVRFRVL